ncbi:7118_t:CDS:1, partial [Ambispora gerdemannii]
MEQDNEEWIILREYPDENATDNDGNSQDSETSNEEINGDYREISSYRKINKMADINNLIEALTHL